MLADSKWQVIILRYTIHVPSQSLMHLYCHGGYSLINEILW